MSKKNWYAVAISDRKDFEFRGDDLVLYILPTMAECRRNAQMKVDSINQGEVDYASGRLFARCIRNVGEAKIVAIELIEHKGNADLETRLEDIAERINQRI